MSYSLVTIRPDGVSSSTSTSYSTDKEEIKINGLVEGYNKITISFLGTLFTSEGAESDIEINGNSWVFPNTIEGIDAEQGENTLQITAEDTGTGQTTTLTLVVITNLDTTATRPQPPTNIKTNRSLNHVDILWAHDSESDVKYYNIYASAISGGGNNGYTLLNSLPIDPITYGKRTEKVVSLVDLKSDIKTIEEDPNLLTIQALQNDTVSEIGTQEIAESVGRLRISTNISSVELETTVSFSHNRRSPDPANTYQIGQYTNLGQGVPLYYVITAVKFVEDGELESAFSLEVGSAPIDLQTVNTTLPNVTDQQLTEEIISTIYNADSNASVQGGSAIRDLFIDPIVSEVSRVRVVMDFCYKATNFVSLNNIDDPTGTGDSLPVENSTYKQLLQEALYLDTSVQMQNLIDLCFDRLASNLGIKRRAGAVARGEVTFFTLSAPTFDLSIPIGQIVSGGGSRFRVLETGTISVDQAPSFYNPLTRRYEITLSIQATVAGISGNLTSNQITSGAPVGLRVSNTAPTFGGSDRETNQQLTARAMTYISSVDVGTKAGYERVARESAGVSGYQVIDADNPYMIRDNGLGGKVDIWVRGEILSRVTDVYAPSYQAYKGSRFIPLNGEGTYKFQASDATVENPLYQMIDREDKLGLKNQTTGEWFDLTGAVITEGKIITLDDTIPQPTYRMTDIILGDYRTNVTSKVILDRQPARTVESVRKADGTGLGYTFYKTEDPLVLGQSSKAQDYVIIDNDGTDKIISVVGEQITLNELYSETLANRGVDTTSIVVKDSNGTELLSPLTSTTPDYIVEVEGEITRIRRTTTSNIQSSQNVFVDYEYLENIVITYQTNLVVSNLQLEIDEQKHMGADVLVKEVSPVRVNIKGLIYINQGVSPSSVDPIVRASLTSRITQEPLGGSLFPSDIIRELDFIQGVNYVSLPLTQISLSQGDQILREEVSPTVPTEINEFTNSSHKVWLIDTELNHVPELGGGGSARVFVDREEIEYLKVGQRESANNWYGVKGSIVGLEGAYINQDGISTLVPNSKRKLMLSLPLGKTPLDYHIEVNYTCGDNSGIVGEIRLNQFSYFEVGELSFTYEESR